MDEYSGFCMRSSRGGFGGGSGTETKCGRWNPTSEQVKVLTELFRSGLRTPSTDQIQKISSQLSFYGKIESKNVFYWFQNHKARERQKRRRVLVDEDNEIINNPHESTKVPSTKLWTDFEDIKLTLEPERAKETLQLFPLNSFNGTDSDNKFRFFADICKENSAFTYNFGTDQMNHHHPTLDLRLSFI